jgi:hypothetical protein
MQTKQKLFLFLVVALLLVNILIPYIKCNPDWLSGWNYRKSHVINSASGAGTNYQVKINVINGTNTDSGDTVYINNKTRSDFGDVRFTKSDGTTLLDYWMETVYTGINATFWVEVADDLSTSAVTIYIYYGNSTATTTSNGANTFLFFDDFSGDLSKWTVLTGTWNIVSGELVASATGVNYIRSASFQPSNARVRAKMKIVTYYDYDVLFRLTDTSNFYQTRCSNTNGQLYHRVDKCVAGTYTTDIFGKVAFTPGTTYHTETALFSGSHIEAYADGAYGVSGTDTTFSSGYIGFKFNIYTTSDKGYVDWIFASKYVYPEPSHGSWGSEETYGEEYSFTLSETAHATANLDIQQEHSYIFTGTVIQSGILEYGAEAMQTLTQTITSSGTTYYWMELSYALTETAKPVAMHSYGLEGIYTLIQTITPTETRIILQEQLYTFPQTTTLQTTLTYAGELAEVFITNIETITLQETIQYWIQRVELPINWGLVALCASILAFSLASAAIASQKTSESD